MSEEKKMDNAQQAKAQAGGQKKAPEAEELSEEELTEQRQIRN